MDATTAGGNADVTFAGSNFFGVKNFNFDVTKPVSAVNSMTVTVLGNDGATVTASDDFTTIAIQGSSTNSLSVDAKAAGTAGSPVTATVTGNTGDVTITGAGSLTVTANVTTSMLSATAKNNLSASATNAVLVSATSTAGNVTITDATKSLNTTVKAAGNVSVDKIDAEGAVSITAGGTIAITGTATGVAGADYKTAVFSSVGNSTIAQADKLTTLTISGNGAAAKYTLTDASALSDVIVAGSQNVTLVLDPSSTTTTGDAVNIKETGSGKFTLELAGTADNLDLKGGGVLDVLNVTKDFANKTLTVSSGQTVTYSTTQTATGGANTLAVGSAASKSTNAVTVLLDDDVRDSSAVTLTALTVTQAKNITIDASVDTTLAGTAQTHTITALTATDGESNVTFKGGVNNIALGTGAITTGSGKGSLVFTGSGTLTDGAGTYTTAKIDASAMTGKVTLDEATIVATTVLTGSADDTVYLTNNIDQTVNMAGGDDLLQLDNDDYSNKLVTIDLGSGNDTLKFVGSSKLLTGSSGSITLSGVETIQFADAASQEIQASLLNGQTYAITSAAAGNAQIVAVKVRSSNTLVDLSKLVGSTTTASSTAKMQFLTDASGNTAAPITISGIGNAINYIEGSAVSGDSLTGGSLNDIFFYADDATLFNADNVMLDTISGGAGNSDAIAFSATTGATIVAADNWSKISGVEVLRVGTDNTAADLAVTGAISLTLGASAQTAGITTIDLSNDSSTTGTNVIDVSAFSAGTTITGSAGAGIDSIVGGSGNDTIVYKVAANLAATNAIIDTVNGGDGTDTLQIGSTTASAAFVLANTDLWGRVASVERVLGTANNAQVFTLAFDPATAYAAGIRTVDISASSATGTHTIDYQATGTQALTLTGASAARTNITGGAGNDIITGGSAGDSLLGGGGDDVIAAGAGANTVNGGTGNDTITVVGSSGANSLVGGDGNDTITGGSGDDTITGGDGSDSIILTSGGTDTLIFGTSGSDTITGFTAGAATVSGYDKIDVNGTGATLTSLGIAADAFTMTASTNGANVTFQVNTILSGTQMAGVTDGVGLLAALKAANNNTTVSIVANAATDEGHILAYQNSNAYLYYWNADGVTADTAVTFDEITLVATFVGVTPGALVAANFV